MSIATEIERIQTAKETLKTKLNAKNDSEHQITNELISDYGNFVDSITGGANLDDYFKDTISSGTTSTPGWIQVIKKIKSPLIISGTNCAHMFDSCILEEIPLIDTSNVTNMNTMFANCKMTTLNLSNFNTSNVTDMGYMFSSSQATTLDLSHFDTSNVTNMVSMFQNSKATTIDVSNFDTSNVTSMRQMFYGSNATTLDLSSFVLKEGVDLTNMFYNCKATVGYARNQETCDKFNNHDITFIPDTLTFVVKPTE